jgi:hypothetical protein
VYVSETQASGEDQGEADAHQNSESTKVENYGFLQNLANAERVTVHLKASLAASINEFPELAQMEAY